MRAHRHRTLIVVVVVVGAACHRRRDAEPAAIATSGTTATSASHASSPNEPSDVARDADAESSADVADDAPPTTVVCVDKLPPAESYGSAGKGAAGMGYDDTAEARRARIEAARGRTTTVRIAGHAPVVVSSQAGACIEGVAIGEVLVVAGGTGFHVTLDATSLVSLGYEPFYAQWQTRSIDLPVGAAPSCARCR